MKISIPVIFASTVSAIPVNSSSPRRNSQDLIQVESTVTAQTSLVSKTSKMDPTDQSANIEAEFASTAEFNDYLDSLNDMSDSELEDMFNELEKIVEDFYGLSINELEKMTEEEFDSLINNF